MSPPKELLIKKRSAANLVQFIKTRTSEVPNYTLLLGAGASVTSGVQSAGELVATWRKELYESMCIDKSDSYDPEVASTFLSRHHGSWYSQQREYSSLFEKKFDLPRQRRMFVENEVAGKQPSIGYSYLIRLIEKNYFNTVFTTNFDDLLNEAFHQFSDLRPILCAHDSSIASITVTSKRPKIIKLHGDYLFDDIKSTVRETESLEDNTKRKFVEFAKDHGLVVVGYSGHDRSIMDVLHFLLKQDDYFKHGIYWCVREGETPSDELTKLLWKDRVYWVEVEGFDELIAQLYQECVGDYVPVSTSLVSQKPLELISRFCNDKYLVGSRSSYIQRDLAKLRQELDQEALVNSLRTIAGGEEEQDRVPNKLRERDAIRLMEIRKLIELNEHDLALQKLQAEISQADYREYKSELLLAKLAVEEERDEFDAAAKTCDMLLNQDPNNAYYILRRAACERDQQRRLGSIARAIELDPYFPFAHRLRARFLEEQLVADPNTNEHTLVAAIVADYEKSLSLNPGIQSLSWSRYLGFLSKHHHQVPDAISKRDECLEALEQMDARSPLFLTLSFRAIADGHGSKMTEEELLHRIEKALPVQPLELRKRLELLKLDALKSFGRHSDLIASLVGFDADSQWVHDSEYVRFRARVYAEVEGKLFDGIRTLKGDKRVRKEAANLRLLLKYLCYARRTEEAQKLLDECGAILNIDDRQDLQGAIFSANGRFDSVLAALRSRKARMTFTGELAVEESHVLLKIGQYAEAERVARVVLDPAHFSNRFDVLIINLEIASFHLHRKVDKPRLSRVAASNESASTVRMCAYLLLDDRPRAAERLKEGLKKDKTELFYMEDWAIWDVLSNKAWRTDFLRTHGMTDGLTLTDLKKAV